MNQLIALIAMLASLISFNAAADSYNDEPVDCFYEANAYHPLCK